MIKSDLEIQLERNKIIEDWARITAIRLQKSLTKKHIGHSGSLAYFMHYVVAGMGGDIDRTKHEFNYYGRFVDMGVGKGQKIESVKGNADLIEFGGQKRRPKKWLGKTTYAEIVTLKELLASKYGEDAANIIKQNIETIL
jgi:hypothetical protein